MKLLKLEILTAVANPTNLAEIMEEVRGYHPPLSYPPLAPP